jgi:hypothetical protein
MICSNCNYKKDAPEGICNVQKGEDGLPVRCVGLWAKDKYFYLGRYLDIFTAEKKNFNYYRKKIEYRALYMYNYSIIL